MLFDYSRLKGKIIEKFGTQGAFADCVKRSQGYISAVLNGAMYLRVDEVETWREALGISVEDVGLYFCAKLVDNE